MLPLVDLTVGARIVLTACCFGNHPAMEYCGRIWSYEELSNIIDQLAAGLLVYGIQKGDHLAILSEAEPNTIIFLCAAQKIGAIPVVLNPNSCAGELSELLDISDSDYLAVGGPLNKHELLGLYSQLALPARLRSTFYIGQGESTTFPCIRSLLQLGEGKPPEFLSRASAKVHSQDTAIMVFTSGSTGKPKAVLGSHYSRVNIAMQLADVLRATEKDRFCVSLPLHHCFAQCANLMIPLSVGACIYFPKSRRTSDIQSAFQIGECTVLSAVPTVFHSLLARADFRPENYRSLRIGMIGGANYTPQLFREIEEKLQFTLISTLGLTEATGGITACNPNDSIEVRSTTVGHFTSHMEGKIVNYKTGAALPSGQVGEICVRGYLLMQGYYKRPDLTKQAVDPEGWLHTGDLGFLDSNGNIVLAGRKKELIIRGGENISPIEIELLISKIPSVSACKVVGVPDKHYGELVCACVVLNRGESLSPAEMNDAIRDRLAANKLPGYLMLLDALPLTSAGKIALSKLKTMAEEYVSSCNSPPTPGEIIAAPKLKAQAGKPLCLK